MWFVERPIGKLVDKKVLRREARGTFDTVEAVAAYVAHRESVVAAEHGAGDYGRARTEWMQERARAAKIDRLEREGSLVSVEDVQTTVTTMFSAVKMYFLGTPTKLAPRLAGLPSVPAMQAVLEREVRQILTELSEAGAMARIRQAARAKRGRRADKGDDDDHAEA